jgi:hypothetical protein
MIKVTPAYNAWRSMRQRCGNPKCRNYPNYGGRGIVVCFRWELFDNFLADMGERPPGRSLDRIDNNGNYEPGNCRWATHSQQQANKRPYKRKLRHELHPRARLTADNVAVIRSLLGRAKQREIANKFNVCQSTISLISSGRTWGE